MSGVVGRRLQVGGRGPRDCAERTGCALVVRVRVRMRVLVGTGAGRIGIRPGVARAVERAGGCEVEAGVALRRVSWHVRSCGGGCDALSRRCKDPRHQDDRGGVRTGRPGCGAALCRRGRARRERALAVGGGW